MGCFGPYFNYNSCRNVADIVDGLVPGRLQPEQIGIIDAYRLDRLLLETVIEDMANKRAKESGRTLETMEHTQVAINTIDGFQGGQRDFIILCPVRANSRGAIGFLSELQRFNVATTRARKGLLIVGDFSHPIQFSKRYPCLEEIFVRYR